MRRLRRSSSVSALIWITCFGSASGAALAAWATAPVIALAIDSAPSPITLTPKITLSLASGLPGTPVTIKGTGFPPGEIVALYIDVAGPYLPVSQPPGPRADAQGAFQESINMPGKNYDPSGHVDPTKAGPHSICGDTAYPGSTQPLPVKACAEFQVLAEPSASAKPSASNTAAPLAELLVAFGVLIFLAAGAILWMRRSK